jgi:hypothetical protein
MPPRSLFSAADAETSKNDAGGRQGLRRVVLFSCA